MCVVFMPGLLGSNMVLARYTGGRPAWEGGPHHPHAASLIDPEDLFVDRELDEVVKDPGYNPIYVGQKLVSWVKMTWDGFQNHSGWGIRWDSINIAQDSDITAFHRRWQRALKKYPPEQRFILWGTSRGAATIFNALALDNKMATENPEYVRQFDPKRIQMVLLEGCYDHVGLVNQQNSGCLFAPTVRSMLYWFTNHDMDCGLQPLDLAKFFPQDIVVAFVTSKADWIVPFERTSNLISALYSHGHFDVHCCCLVKSGHSSYSTHNEDDKKTYATFVQTLRSLTLRSDS